MILQAEYPDTFKDLTDDALKAKVRLWAEMFPEPFEVVSAAVKKYIKTSRDKYMPTIGIITDLIYSEQGTANEAEAWEMVRKACSNGYYGAENEFNKLPPIIQKVVGSPSQIRDWSLMPSDTFNSVVASNFQRAYKTMLKREIEDLKTPPDVKMILNGIGDKLKLNGQVSQKQLTD